MFKFYIKIILFVVLGFTLFLGINTYIDDYRVESAELKYDFLRKNTSGHEIENIILGSSHAEAGIDPQYLESDNFRIYNFAYSGAAPEYFLYWYKNIYRFYHPPAKRVIYAVDWFMFDTEWLWRRIEHDSEYLPWREKFQLLTISDSPKKLFKNMFPIYKTDFSIINMLLSKQNVPGYYKGHYDYTIPSDSIYHRPVDPEQVSAFSELLQIFEADGTQVIFVMTPELIENNKKDAANIQLIRNIADEYQIPILDFNDWDFVEETFSEADFLDWGHLNSSGSRIFSEQLSQQLLQTL